MLYGKVKVSPIYILSQGFSLIKDDSASPDLTESAISKDSHLSFFKSESESQNKKNKEKNQFLASAGKRRMSL